MTVEKLGGASTIVASDGSTAVRAYFLLFIAVAATFFLIRMTEGPVWNDSPQLAENMYGFQNAPGIAHSEAPVCREEGAYGLNWSAPDIWRTLMTRAFSCLEFGGYRPLSAALSFVGVSTYSTAYSEASPNPFLETAWIAFVAALFGITAVLLFSLSRDFVRTKSASYAVVFLFFCSAPVVSGSWILFSGGIQITVPLFICLGLWTYRKVAQGAKPGAIWLVAFAAVLLLGPWIREYIGIVPILVILLELLQHRRITWLGVLAFLGLLHALFPTALARLMYESLPLLPVSRLGSLAVQLNGDSSPFAIFYSAKWAAAQAFLAVVPPTLLVVTIPAILWSLRSNRKVQIALCCALAALALWWNRPWFPGLLVLAFCIATMVQSAWAAQKPETTVGGWQLSGPGKTLFLNAWLLISLLPFLKVFSAHVHLAYPLIPALLLIARATEPFWEDILRERRAHIGTAFRTIILIAFVDQAMNVYGSYVTVSSLYSGARSAAEWMRSNTPKHTIVIANALHAEDIRFYSHDHILPYWSVGVGVPPERTLEKPEKLDAFLHAHLGTTPVLMLDIGQPFPLAKGDYHAHKYITRNAVKVRKVGEIYSARRYYFFIDPLKNFLPVARALFLGPPDLENDVYHGRALNRTPFTNEVSFSYSVYSVNAPDVSRSAYFMPDSTFLYPRVVDHYRDYRLVGYRERFFGVPSQIPVTEDVLKSPDNKRILAARSLEELKDAIDKMP